MIATKAKPKTVNWSKAKTVKIPIPRTGKTFRAYPEDPPRPCEVAASFSFAPAPGGRWAWRIELDTPLFKDGDPDCDKRAHVASEDLAVRAAIDKIISALRFQVEFRRTHKQTEVAAACANAVWHCERFGTHYRGTGKFLTTAAIPGGTKTRQEIEDEIEAVVKKSEAGGQKAEVRGQRSEVGAEPSTAIATVAPIDVVSQPLEKLTKSEEADLRRCIKTIEREAISAEATDLALIEVQEKQLWRKTHASFQAWIEGTKFAGKTLDRASAYLRIHAMRIRRKLAAVKNPPAVEITSPSQCKSIPADIDGEDLRAVVLKIKPDPDRKRRWTDDLMRRLLHEDRTDAEQLRQEEFERKNRAADAARLRAAQKQLGAHQTESREDRDDAGDISPAETPSTPAEWQRAAQERADVQAKIRPAAPSRVQGNTLAAIASQEGWWEILNQPPLEGLSSIVYRMQALSLGHGDGEFTKDLVALDLVERLHSLAAEISGETTLSHGLTHSSTKAAKVARRAK